MGKIRAEQLGRAGVGVAEQIEYDRGYKQGAADAIARFSNWVDEDTIESVREEFGLDAEY